MNVATDIDREEKPIGLTKDASIAKSPVNPYKSSLNFFLVLLFLFFFLKDLGVGPSDTD